MSSGIESEFTTQSVEHAGLMPKFEAEVREAQVNLGTGLDIMGRAEHHERPPGTDPSAVVIQDDGPRTVLGGLPASARTSEPVFMLNGMRTARVESVATKLPAAEQGKVEMPETRGTGPAEELILEDAAGMRRATDPGIVFVTQVFHHSEAEAPGADFRLFMDDTVGMRGDDALIVDDSLSPGSGHGVEGAGSRTDVPDDKGENNELGDSGSGVPRPPDHSTLGTSGEEPEKHHNEVELRSDSSGEDRTGRATDRSDLVIYRKDGGVIILDGVPIDATSVGVRPDGIDRTVWGDQMLLFKDWRGDGAPVAEKDPQAFARLITTYRSLLVGETANAVDISRMVGYLHMFAEATVEQRASKEWRSEQWKGAQSGVGSYYKEIDKLEQHDGLRFRDIYEAIASTDELLTYTEGIPEIHHDLNMLQSYLIERVIRHTEAVDNGGIIRDFGEVRSGPLNKHLVAQRLKIAGVSIEEGAESVLSYPANAFPKHATVVDVVGIRVSDLFLGHRYIPLEPILEYGDHFGLNSCPPWVAPLLLLQGRVPEQTGGALKLSILSHGTRLPGSKIERLAFTNKILTTVTNQVGEDDTILFERPKR